MRTVFPKGRKSEVFDTMRSVYIIGTGQVPVTKHGEVRSRHMAARAITAALADARMEPNEITADAFLRKPVDMAAYLSPRVVAAPVKLLDAPPICDGSAAVVLATEGIARSIDRAGRPAVGVRGSAMATDSLALKGRREPLVLDGAALSTARALAQAGIGRADVDLFELHDAYTVITALSLEAAGFAAPGGGAHFGKDGEIAIDGRLPISTMGGLKARGHPVGATGVYQLVESWLQLTGAAAPNQIRDPEIAMVQNIGGTGGHCRDAHSRP